MVDRVDFLLVAVNQFEPFLWARDEAKETDTDAAWAKRFPKKLPSDFVESEPILYLYSAILDLRNAMFDPKGGLDEEVLKATATIIAMESLMMIARQSGIEENLPTWSAWRLPISDAFLDLGGDETLDDIWFYRMFLERDFMTDAIRDLSNLLLRSIEFGLENRLAHEARSEVPWDETEIGGREKIESLRVMLSSIYAIFFVQYRDETLEVLQVDITTKLYAGTDTKTIAEGRPDFTLYVRGDADDQEAREYYARYGVEMAEKLAFIAEHAPEIGDPEKTALLGALGGVDLGPIEAGVWRYDPKVPQTQIWEAMSLLGGPLRPKLAWMRYPQPPPTHGYALAEPYLSGDIDPTMLDSEAEYAPVAIDLTLHAIEQYNLDPLEWLTEMAREPKQLRIAAMLLSKTEGSPVSVFDEIALWKICFEDRAAGSNAIDASRTDEEIALRKKTVDISTLPNPGNFRLVRLRPVEGITLL